MTPEQERIIQVTQHYIGGDPEIINTGIESIEVNFYRIGLNHTECIHLANVIDVAFDIEPVSNEQLKIVLNI